MAETETPDANKNVIKIEEEIEGDIVGTRNYRFSRVGEPVPIKSDADFKFELDSVPRRPLAVSERFGVIFVAHPSGFCVARTKDVMDTAEELKNGGNGSCIQALSVVDVSLGKVSILALSANSSMLAASVEHNLYFFSVAGLLNKDHQPSFSKSLNSSSCIKDMQWSTHLDDQLVVLTSDGNLYRGAGQDDLSNLMDNVDAVNWSMNGKFLAVARYEYIIILSSKFEEKLRIKLSFDSLPGDSDANCVVKVDSVKWVRPDCLIVGCYRQSPDGMEDSYLVQFVTVKEGRITNPSSNPVALTFCDAFLTINDDYIPFGNGPYMLVSYLAECEIAFATHRKSTDQHIVLFGWSSDEKNEAKMIEISHDAWLPTIGLQDNSDDNLVLGLAVNKVFQDDKIRFVLGEEDTEVSPCCVLLCLTLDGKLLMFHFASATGPSVLPEDVISDEEEESSPLSSDQQVNISNDKTQIGDQALHELQHQKVKVDEPSGKTGSEALKRSGDEQTTSTAFPKLLIGAQQDVPVAKPNDSRDEAGSLPLQKQDSDFKAALFKASEPVNPETVEDLRRFENQEVAGVKSSADSVSNSALAQSDNKFFGASLQGISASRELSVNKASTGLHASSGSFSSGSVFSSNIFGVQSFSSPHAGVQGSAQQDVSVARLIDGRDKGQSLSLQKQDGNLYVAPFKASEPVNPGAAKDLQRFENQEVSVIKSSADSVSKSANDKSDNTLFGASFEDRRAGRELSVNKASTGLHGSSGSFSSGSVFPSNIFGAQSFSSPHAGTQGSAELSGKTGSANLPVSSGSFSSGGIFSSRTFDVKSPLLPHAAVQGNRPDTSAGSTQFSSGPQKFSFPKMISGTSTSSSLLGQGASTGAGITYSLPVVSNVQPSLGKSSAFDFSDKGNQRSHTPSRPLSSEPNLSEQRSVEEMAKELDALLNSIEGPGGFFDASVAAHKPSVMALEEGIWVLSDKCRKWINTMDQGIGEVQILLDKTVQVLARKIYMEAIVKQATDSQYLDIWNRQKLNSELDMKRKRILEINQNLTNQLIELERHLNTLELQRFGDRSDVQMNRRSPHTKHGPPRHVQSLHSLHNTMNAQLAAAEKLSDCLSKQMAVLSIETEPVKSQNVKKELFDTIGISYDGTTFSSPGQEKARGIPLKSKVLVPSCSTVANTDMKKSQGALKSSEPETARRRRDSLDRSWASIEPPKTTVKRMLLQEDRQMSPGRLSLPTGPLKLNHRLSEGSVVSHDIPRGALNMSQGKGSQDVQIKRYSGGQSNSSLWDSNRSDSSKSPVTSVLSLGSGSQTMPIITQDAARNLKFTLKSDPVLANEPKFSPQSQSFLDASSNSTGSLAKNIFHKKTIEFPLSSSKDNVKSKFAVGDGNQRPIAAESSSIWSRKSPESPFSAVSSAGSGTAFSGKSFSLEASTKESQVGQAVSSAIASLPVPVTSTPTSFVFKDATPSTTSTISPAKSSTSFGFKLGATQTLPPSGSSASFPSFSSTPSFGATKEPTSSIKPSTNIELNTSKPEVSKSNPDASENSTPHLVSVPKFDLKPDVTSSAQTSPPQTVISSGSSNMKLGFSAPSEPKSEPPTVSFSGSQLNLSATTSPILASSSKPEQPVVTPAVSSSPAVSNPVEEVGKENENSDVTLTQEDEMEEEAPDTTQVTLGNLGGFGLGSAPNPSAPKQNPFGAPFGSVAANTPIPSFTAAPSTGGLFRPASFNIASSQPSQPSQQTSFGGFSSGFGSNNNQSNAGQGFGQPARIGSGQQALGSVLGSFGQSRQFGAGLPGSVASPSPFGSGFGSSQTAGGFATASSGGGFANLASGGGGFGGLATGGGGFAAAPAAGGGFAAAATASGGFAAAATGSGGFGGAPAAGGGFAGAATGSGGFGGAPAAGGGFGGAAPGGFGAFGSQGGSGFSAFGSTGGTARPPSELFTQMRK